jgi:hypothetical protein
MNSSNSLVGVVALAEIGIHSLQWSNPTLCPLTGGFGVLSLVGLLLFGVHAYLRLDAFLTVKGETFE